MSNKKKGRRVKHFFLFFLNIFLHSLLYIPCLKISKKLNGCHQKLGLLEQQETQVLFFWPYMITFFCQLISLNGVKYC